MVRIRLKKVGRRHQPSFRVAAIERRRTRDSIVIEELGYYRPDHPLEAQQVQLNADRIKYWLGVGAQPSDTVRRLLEKAEIVPESTPRRKK